MKRYNIELDITRECNFCCPSCNRFCDIRPKNTKSIMNMADIEKIVRLIQILKIRNLNVMGGEPTLNPHIIDIIRYLDIHINAEKKIIRTNNSNKEILDVIRNEHTSFIILSDDGDLNVRDIKVTKHINLYNVVNDGNNGTTRENCMIFRDDGMCIYKFNGKILFSPCVNATFYSRLLGLENKFSRDSLAKCLMIDINLMRLQICPSCMLYVNTNSPNYIRFYNEKYRDFSKVSDTLKDGLDKIKNNDSDYV